MLKKTITYTNYNDEEVKEDFYFNLNNAELIELEATTPGGFANYIQSVADAKNMPKLMELFKKIIMMSYGEKSADGKRFLKSEAISNAFVQTEAYSDLLMELLSKDGAAVAFINGILPKETTNIPAPAAH